jgi:hypothetical protein
VLLPGAVRQRSDAGEKVVGREASQLDGYRARGLEVEVEAGDVIEAWRKGLAVAERVDLTIGQGLLLVRDSVRASGRRRCR